MIKIYEKNCKKYAKNFKQKIWEKRSRKKSEEARADPVLDPGFHSRVASRWGTPAAVAGAAAAEAAAAASKLSRPAAPPHPPSGRLKLPRICCHAFYFCIVEKL